MEIEMTEAKENEGKQDKASFFERFGNSIKSETSTLKFLLEIGALVVVCIYTYYASQQACAAIKQAKSAQDANRPYVGVAGMVFEYVDKARKPDGSLILSHSPTSTSNSLAIPGRVKNYGPIPGLNFKVDWKVIIGGVIRGGDKIPGNTSTIYPTQEIILPGTIGPDDFKWIMHGDKTLIAEITMAYDGPGGHYNECDKQQFTPDVNGFVDLGGCS
jgi:hypothetical protein